MNPLLRLKNIMSVLFYSPTLKGIELLENTAD